MEIYVEEKETEKAVKHFDRLLMQVHNKFMPLVESYAYYRRGYLHYYLKEYELAAQRFRESIAVNQQYNMNLNASLPFLGLAMASTEMEKADLAMSNFRESLECLRLSGSNVEFTCFKYALCQFLAKTGQTENALRLFVSIQKDYAKTHYRPWITLRICLDYSEEILRSSYSPEFIAAKMNDTDELSREEIYVMVD
jgi:tetratricopeptide (TPR) repeat protein